MKSDYTTLKFGLEKLAIDGDIPIHNSRVLKNCMGNADNNIVVDTTDIDSSRLNSFIDKSGFDVTRINKNTILLESDNSNISVVDNDFLRGSINDDNNVVMDVSDYSSKSIQAIINNIDLKIYNFNENTLIIEGDFGLGPDISPY